MPHTPNITSNPHKMHVWNHYMKWLRPKTVYVRSHWGSMWVDSSLWWEPGITSDVRIKGWQSPAKVSALDPARIKPESPDTHVQ